MFLADLTPQLHERVVCSIAAAVKYEIPANIVLAVAEKEGGKSSQWPQQNATYRADLMVKAKKWADWLAARFVTVDVTKTATGSGASTNLPRDRSR